MKRKYSVIALDNPKHEVNVGSVMRAAGIYGVTFVAASGKRYKPGNTDVNKEYLNVPLLYGDDIFNFIPFDCVPVAVDLVEGAQSLFNYKHPDRAFYIFGAEDNTLGKRIISRCRDVVYIPTNGCMNLAATVNVVLYDRMMKESENNENI